MDCSTVDDTIQPSHPLSSSPFSSCPQSFPASESFVMSWLFVSGGQIIGASTSTLVLPMNIQGWSPLGWTGLISCCPRDSQESSQAPQFKSNNFFGAQPSLWATSHICTWWEKYQQPQICRWHYPNGKKQRGTKDWSYLMAFNGFGYSTAIYLFLCLMTLPLVQTFT